jgi:hypothetical protein
MASGVFRLKPLDKLKGVKDFKVRALKLAKPVGGETSIDLRDDTAKEVWDRLGRQPRDWKLAQRVGLAQSDADTLYLFGANLWGARQKGRRRGRLAI